jgi:hypothetical protein
MKGLLEDLAMATCAMMYAAALLGLAALAVVGAKAPPPVAAVQTQVAPTPTTTNPTPLPDPPKPGSPKRPVPVGQQMHI